MTASETNPYPASGIETGELRKEGPMQALVAIIARIVLGIPFLVFGFFHLTGAAHMTGAVPPWLPAPLFWVYFTGVAMILGGLGVITDKLGAYAGLGLIGLLLTFILTVHLPGLGRPEGAQMAMIGLLKDLALAGGLLANVSVSLARSASAASAAA
jgi:putative oxidoreductase